VGKNFVPASGQSKGLVLDANGADIQGSVFLRGAKSKGGLDFIGATIGGDLDCSAGEFKGAAETPTLNLNRGLQEQAKKLMIAKNKDYATYRRWRMDWLWYGLLGKLVGYGYRPWRAFWVSLSVIVLGWLVFWCGYHCRIITPLDEKAYKPGTPQLMDLYPRFNAFVYSLETFVPFLKLVISDHWTPDATRSASIRIGLRDLPITGGMLRLYLWIHITVGWILTTLWVGDLTG
jgi:hypothetical protein